MASGEMFEYSVIRRTKDNSFLAYGTQNTYFDLDIRNAMFYTNEEYVRALVEDLSIQNDNGPCEVWYVSLSLSNVRR